MYCPSLVPSAAIIFHNIVQILITSAFHYLLQTYDSDAAIFDMLIAADSAVDSKSEDDHPLLAICKVGVCMQLLMFKSIIINSSYLVGQKRIFVGP